MPEVTYIPATTGRHGYWQAEIGYGSTRFIAEGPSVESALMELLVKVHEQLEN